MRFGGQVRFGDIVHPAVPVTFVVDDNQAEMVVEGESLGRWSLYDVQARRLVSNAFQIELQGEEITFLADDPLDFAYRGVEHMAEAWARYRSMNPAQRVVAVMRSRQDTKPSKIEVLRQAMLANVGPKSRSILAGEMVASGEFQPGDVGNEEASPLKRWEVKDRYSQKMEPEERMDQAARLGTVRFGEEVADSTTAKAPDTTKEPVAEGPSPVSGEGPDLLVGRTLRGQSPANGLEGQRADLVEIKSAQRSVVAATRLAMQAWFGYYFRTAEGTGQERLNQAITGLREAATQLRATSGRLEARGAAAPSEEVGIYRRAVEGWAEAFDLIADGVELDQRSLAEDGFVRLRESTELAHQVVDAPVNVSVTRLRHDVEQSPAMRATLSDLAALTPAAKVPRRAVSRAKQPWETMLLAAGSPLRRR